MVGVVQRRCVVEILPPALDRSAEFARGERAGDVEEELLVTGVGLGVRIVSRNEIPGPDRVDAAIGVAGCRERNLGEGGRCSHESARLAPGESAAVGEPRDRGGMPQRPVQLATVNLSDTPCAFGGESFDRPMDLDHRCVEIVVEGGIEILSGQLAD